MPSHQDRVRRNYHNIDVLTYDNHQNSERILSITVTKHEMATWASNKEIRRMISKKIQNATDNSFKK